MTLRKLAVVMVLVAFGILPLSACVAEHTGHTPGNPGYGIPSQPPSTGPFAARYGPGCLRGPSGNRCGELLGLMQGTVNVQAVALAQPTYVDAMSDGSTRATTELWELGPSIAEAMMDIKGSLTFGANMKLFEQEATRQVFRGQGKTAGFTATASYSIPSGMRPKDARILVNVVVTAPPKRS